jgi:hypothetical protein
VDTVSATGTFILPMIIYPRVRMNPVGSFSGTTATANPSGWIDSDLFVQFLAHFIECVRPNKESLVLLILDGHTSHKSLKAINMCCDNGIFMVTLPPHTNNRLQPLDVAVYSPFKTYLSQEMDKCMTNHPEERITDYTSGPIIREAYIRAFTPHNMMRGFQQAGISPFNPGVFTDDDFIGACANCSSGSPVPSSVEQPGPSNGTSPSTLVQFPARTKLCTTPSTDHIISSPNESHPYLREYLPLVDPEISPLPKHKNKSAMKTGSKADRSEEITGSPYKSALEIKLCTKT